MLPTGLKSYLKVKIFLSQTMKWKLLRVSSITKDDTRMQICVKGQKFDKVEPSVKYTKPVWKIYLHKMHRKEKPGRIYIKLLMVVIPM